MNSHRCDLEAESDRLGISAAPYPAMDWFY
jgi:hypothetical protein